MLMRRLVVCLDVRAGRVVKGTRFQGLREVGDPADLAHRYGEEGADEIVVLDISASADGRGTLLDVVRRTAERLFIPLTVGGGVRSVDDVASVLRAGADKTGINSAAVARPALLTEAADQFGAQCVVASIDARRRTDAEADQREIRWEVVVHGGRTPTARDAVEWAQECVARGAGELLVTSIDADGTRLGYDLALTRAISSVVSVPVVASGGAGTPADVCAALIDGGADAALVAGIVHDGVSTIAELKAAMAEAGLPVRSIGSGRAVRSRSKRRPAWR
jgi:cyclase